MMVVGEGVATFLVRNVAGINTQMIVAHALGAHFVFRDHSFRNVHSLSFNAHGISIEY